MKSSKHVETCFVRANNDFDDKLTAFWMKNNFWPKSQKTDTVGRRGVGGHAGVGGVQGVQQLPQPLRLLRAPSGHRRLR